MATTPLSLYDQANTSGSGQPINFNAVSSGTVTNPTTPTATTALSSNNMLSQPGAAPVPTGTLPTPVTNNNLSPTGHTTARPGGNTAATSPLATSQPQLSVTQMLNTPVPATTDLAAQYGTMGTSNTQTDLGAKYQAFHENVKGTEAPATNPMRTQDSQDKLAENQKAPDQDPEKTFFDQYSSMNPVVKQMYDLINETLSSTGAKTSFVEEYNKMRTEQGIPGLQTELMNIKNIMSGTEDDIRNEVTKAGGFATESQVAALTASRNKVLLKQATSLQEQLTTKEDYVKQIMDLSKADKTEVDKQLDQKLGLVDKLYNIQKDMDTAATANYQKTLTALGNDYTAFASTVPGNLKPTVEKLLGLAPGTLSDPQQLAHLTESSLKQQQLAQGAQKLQVSVNNSSSLDAYRAALTDLAGARTRSADATTVNSVVRTLYPSAAANPINLYQSSSQWINKVNTAYAESTNPKNTAKNVSDLELLDAAVKINNGGQQITEAQINTLLGGASIPAKVTVQGGKLIGISAILTDNQRAAIKRLATQTLAGQRELANSAVQRVNAELSQRGAPSNLDLPAITSMTASGSTRSGTLEDGTTVYQDGNGNITDDYGNKYDLNGNRIN